MPDDAPLTPVTPLTEWLDAVAAPRPTPAGGSAAAIAAALAASLAEMVAGITRSRERYAASHDRAAVVLERAGAMRAELLTLAVQDAEVFALFTGARGEAKERALREAAEVQLEVLRRASAVADLAATMADVGAVGALGDAATGTFLAAAAARSAYWAMRADLDVSTPESAAIASRGLELVEKAEAAEWRVRQIATERIR
ncbi:MAG: cyclodeaminase/cyclohydrolase family protein [Gemmatimonadales bacterium]